MVQGDHRRAPQRNEEFGMSETPLLQVSGDLVTEMLSPSLAKTQGNSRGKLTVKILAASNPDPNPSAVFQ
jgi:hypothetical protein